MRKVLRVVLIAPLVGVLALIAIGTAFPASETASPTPDSPLATVDDVYVALTAELHGATPDFETQVKPVLDLGLTYGELQATAKANGGLMGAVAAAAAAAPIAPTQAPPAPPTRAPAVAAAAAAVPNAARTVTVTQVLNVVRSEWTQQPQPICSGATSLATCPPGPDVSRLNTMACDHAGDVIVPAHVSCTYVDSALGPGTLAIDIDANNVVIWRGCSPPGLHVFGRDCVQAAPTPAPIVALPPANAPVGAYCGREFISISDIGSPSGPKAIIINGALIGYDSILRSPVAPGSYNIIIRNPDGTLRSSFVAQVPTCGGFTSRRN